MLQTHLAEWVKLFHLDHSFLGQPVEDLLESVGIFSGATRLTLTIHAPLFQPRDFAWVSASAKSKSWKRPVPRTLRRSGPQIYRQRPDTTSFNDLRLVHHRQAIANGDGTVVAEMGFFWRDCLDVARARAREAHCLRLVRTVLFWTCGPVLRDPSTSLPNHVQLARDLADLKSHRLEAALSGCLVLVELVDHELVRRIFLGTGSQATDQLLRDIAVKLRPLLAPGCALYYVGVGRFAIVAPGAADATTALLWSIEKMLQLPFQSDELFVRLHAVVGVVPLSEALDDPADALRKASVSTHQAKSCQLASHLYDREFDQQQIRAHGLLQDIPNAIAGNEFFLVFQPKINLSTGACHSVEALLRWTHPRLGPISPAEFIPLAENTELIQLISRWVFTDCVRAAGRLRQNGLSLSIALNISAHNLADPLFSQFLAQTLADSDVAAADFQIECTEYSALASTSCTKTLHEIAAMGFAIALDDFGCGYSNLSCLNDLPIDYLKIDRSLIHQIDTDRRAYQLLDGVVQLGKRLGYQIVAEGVETATVLAMVKALHIDEVQGFYLSRPLAFDRLLEFATAPGGASF
jgi:EAL domain-containing protein (putative c-di-GMP-specific phosphodiesterase class I)/GGDEF domain-containing protein